MLSQWLIDLIHGISFIPIAHSILIGAINLETKQFSLACRAIYRMKLGGALDWYNPIWIRAGGDSLDASCASWKKLVPMNKLGVEATKPASVSASNRWQLAVLWPRVGAWSAQLSSMFWWCIPEWAIPCAKPIQWVPIKLASKKLRAIHPRNCLFNLLKNKASMHWILQYLPLQTISV